MYDHSPQSSTTKLHRSSSTKTHISNLMPLHHSHVSSRSQYSPNTRQADISRLLDPAYASSSSGSTTSSSGNVRAYTRAYVDHTGEMHDPDYRDFPVLPARRQSSLSKPRRSSSTHSRISTSTSNANRPDRYKTYPLVARPEWERGWSTEVEDLDEEEEEPSSFEGGLRSPLTPSSSSSERTPSSRRASLPPSVYTYSPSYYFSEPVSTTSSPVDSLEEEQEAQEAESPFEDMVEEEPRSPGSTSRTAASILRKMKRSSSASAVPVVPTRSDDEPQDKEMHEMQLVIREDDEVPSCTDILGRQLRALNLRLRFGVFHAKRRLSITRRGKSSQS